MAITTVLINVADVERSATFYRRFLHAELVGEAGPDSALLDLVTARISLRRLERGTDSGWVGDDLQAGFRHLGFKVDTLEPMVEQLKSAGVPFHLDPLDAEGGVRITFFFDPDGTLLELVQGPLQYHEVFDRGGVEADWALGTPDRPRFDHVAETVNNFEMTQDYYGALGFQLIGGIHQPNDPRGFEIRFLRAGDTSLEVFTYDRAQKQTRAPQLDAPGFVAIGLEGAGVASSDTAVGEVGGQHIVADPDGLLHFAAAVR